MNDDKSEDKSISIWIYYFKIFIFYLCKLSSGSVCTIPSQEKLTQVWHKKEMYKRKLLLLRNKTKTTVCIKLYSQLFIKEMSTKVHLINSSDNNSNII